MKHITWPRWRVAVFLLVGLLSGGGCIKIDATLSLNRDGGGTLRAMYGMPSFLIKQLDVTRQWTRSLEVAEGRTNAVPLSVLDIPMVFDEPLLNAKFRKMAVDGVILETLRTRDQGGWKYVDFTVKFNRLERLMQQSFFKDCGVSFKVSGDETCKLSVTLPESAPAVTSGALGSPEAIAKLTPFLNGLRVVVRIDLPGDIRNSTSSVSDSRRATWEWDFDKDIHVLDRLAQEKMIVLFDGSLIRMKEFEKPAGSNLAIAK